MLILFQPTKNLQRRFNFIQKHAAGSFWYRDSSTKKYFSRPARVLKRFEYQVSRDLFEL